MDKKHGLLLGQLCVIKECEGATGLASEDAGKLVLCLLHLQPLVLSFFFLSFLPSLSASIDGVAAFRAFLKTEFSEENLEFWLACEEFKKTRSTAKLVTKAHRIFEEFVDVQAPREVSLS